MQLSDNEMFLQEMVDVTLLKINSQHKPSKHGLIH
jgi:hypothetical protein